VLPVGARDPTSRGHPQPEPQHPPEPQTEPEPQPLRRILGRGSWPEVQYVASALRTETVGGALLLGAAVLALVWANTPWRTVYESLRDLRVGPLALYLDLTLGQWSTDGLLALFFLVAGIELKRELVAGDLSDRSRAALPIAAALCGVAVPAILYAVPFASRGVRATRCAAGRSRRPRTSPSRLPSWP